MILPLAYLLGSIPFGLLLAQAYGLGDVRRIGSGNIGATNVLRTGNKQIALATLLLDMLKGALAVLLAQIYAVYYDAGTIGSDLPVYALYAVVIGHVFPVWLRFKGGKGVATLLGGLLALDARIALVFAAVWLIVFFATRYSSAAALCAATVMLLSPLALDGTMQGAGMLVPLWLLLLFTHRANIGRLLNGTESRFQSTPRS